MADKPERKRLKIKPLAPSSVPSVVDAELVEIDDCPLPVDAAMVNSMNGDPLAVGVTREMLIMAGIGRSIEGVGTVRVGRGIVLMTQESLIAWMRKARAFLDKTENVNDLLELSKGLHRVTQSVAKLSKEYNDQNVPAKGKPQRRSNSFDLGKPVSVIQNNYYGQDKPKGDG